MTASICIPASDLYALTAKENTMTVETILNHGRPVMIETDARDDDAVPFASVIMLTGHGDKVAEPFTADELREVADAMEALQAAKLPDTV